MHLKNIFDNAFSDGYHPFFSIQLKNELLVVWVIVWMRDTDGQRSDSLSLNRNIVSGGLTNENYTHDEVENPLHVQEDQLKCKEKSVEKLMRYWCIIC